MHFLLSDLKHIEPTPVVKTFADAYPPCSMLDIGVGTGRNAIFLAQRGFTVTATDKEDESVAQIQTFSRERQLPITTKVADIASETPAFADYDAVLFSFVLHYLKASRAHALLQHALDSATKDCVHVISAVTTEGDFYKNKPDNYYPAPGELKDMYTNACWKIVNHAETTDPMRATHPDGIPMSNLVTHLITEKQ